MRKQEVLDLLRDKAIEVQDDEPYGAFSHPVVLGLLLAMEIVESQ